MSAAKVERLMSLLQVLLDAPRPLTADEVRARVPGYAEEKSAFRRTFERDKAELGEILRRPVRAEPVPGTDPPADGYRIRPEDAFLRDPGLTDEERRALAVAASAVRLAGVDPRLATTKVRAEADGEVPEAATEIPADADVVSLFQAVAERRVARFAYRGEDRTVHPLRLRFARGRWYLTALDTGRGAERLFRVDRIDGGVRTGAPGGFDAAPAGQGDHLDEPWMFGEGDPIEARVLVDAERAETARRAAPRAEVEERPDGSVVLVLPVRNVSALRSFVLGFGEDAEVLGPPEVRAEVVRWLEAVAAGATA